MNEPELIWKKCIDLEIEQGEMENARYVTRAVEELNVLTTPATYSSDYLIGLPTSRFGGRMRISN